MQNPNPNPPVQIKVRVRLEPELEELAAQWTPLQCLATSQKLARWSRQLKIKAMITLRDERLAAGRARPVLRPLPRRKAAMN